MPRLAGFRDWESRGFFTRLEYMNASTKVTKQGVRDLNPRGFNGRKSTTCPHHRAPDITPTHTTSRLVDRHHDARAVPAGQGRFVTVYFDSCSLCGDELCEKP